MALVPLTPPWIPIIINPTTAHRASVLALLNRIYTPAGVRWTVEVTHGAGDAVHLARRLSAQGAGVVAVYGGDGTISEAAWGLAGTQTNLAILPGGTGNVLAFEFGIPRSLTEAAQLILCGHRIRTVDMGEVYAAGSPDERQSGSAQLPTGGRKFLLRVGAGVEAMAIKHAPRRLKERLGLMAYGVAALQALIETRPVLYHLDLDGVQEEAQGVVCSIANAGHLGILPGFNMPPVSIDDGLLDIIILNRVDLENIISILTKNLNDQGAWGNLRHWQVRQASIVAEPNQSAQVDGDHLGHTPLHVRCVPQALRMLVPE